MSTPEFPKESAGGGPSAKKSNTWIIVLVVVLVLGLPALCLCGGLAVWWGIRLAPVEQGHEAFPPKQDFSEIEFRQPQDPQPVSDSPADGTKSD